MRKNTFVALLMGSLLILGALSILTDNHLYVVFGICVVGVTWFSSPKLFEVNEPKESAGANKLLFGKINIGALLLGWLSIFITTFLFNCISIMLFAPSIYYYLGQSDYAHPAFPLAWENIENIITGFIAGYVIARFSRPFSLINTLAGGLLFQVCVDLLSLDDLMKDPAWYAIAQTLSFSLFWWLGWVVDAYLVRQQPKTHRNVQPEASAAHIIWFFACATTIIALYAFLDIQIKHAAPPDIFQQLEQRADAGDKIAAERTADVYYFGKSKNFAKAASYFTQAAQKGSSHSQVMLGKMYYEGDGVKQDYLLAYQWLSLGDKNEHVAAKRDLALAKSYLTANQINVADAWVAKWSPSP